MAKGRIIGADLDRQGFVSYQTAVQWPEIYTTSLVKDPQWNIGDHIELADGRECARFPED